MSRGRVPPLPSTQFSDQELPVRSTLPVEGKRCLLQVQPIMDEPINASVETPVVEETNETPQVETETTQEEVTNEAPAEPSEEQPKELDSVDKKPTRSEKRVHQLLNKLKDKGEPQSNDVFGQNMPPWWNNTQPLDPNREYTLEELNAIQEQKSAQKAYTATQIAIAQERQRNQFISNVEKYQSELEEVAKSPEFSSKDFDSRFTELYNSINMDETGNFKPKKSPKEIYQILKGTAEMGANRGMMEASKSMAQTIANAAVTPTASRAEDPNAKSRELFNEARNNGSTDAWAAYLKTIK